MTALTAPTVRVPRPKQSAAQRQAVYDYVTERDKMCRAPVIEPANMFIAHTNPHACIMECSGRLHRHHAGVKMGTNRNKITDARHVVLLCQYHHKTWAPTHSRLILEWLKRIEDARGSV